MATLEKITGLPKRFCWTRFGTEAGQGIEKIIARKERERLINGGIFLWGIGNAIGPSIQELIQVETHPEVVFSPIRSKPRMEDVNPTQVVMWMRGRTVNGEIYDLPDGSIVTSRFSGQKISSGHYALICASSSELHVDENGEPFKFGNLRNLKSGNPVGASQVTAVVSKNEKDMGGPSYVAAMRTNLVFPYVIRLVDPVPVPNELLHRYAHKNENSAFFDFARKARAVFKKDGHHPNC